MRMLEIALALLATIAIAPAAARAQDAAPAMPDSAYGGEAGNYGSPADVPMPAPEVGRPLNSVTIPIPGGGEIHVDGPDAPASNPLPTLPGSQWGVTQQTPHSHDVGPNGP